VNGIAGQVRVGDMALLATDEQTRIQRAAPAILHHVADQFGTGGFADDAPVDLLATLSERLHHPYGTVHCRPFLIAGDQEGDGAAMSGVVRNEALYRYVRGGKAVLRVGCTVSILHAVAYFRR